MKYIFHQFYILLFNEPAAIKIIKSMSQSKKPIYDADYSANKNETFITCKQKPRTKPEKTGRLWKLLKIEMQIQKDQLAFIYALENAREETVAKYKHDEKMITKQRKSAIARNIKQNTKRPEETTKKLLKPKKRRTKLEEKTPPEEYIEQGLK